MVFTHPRARLAVALVAFLAPLLAACGGDDDATASPDVVEIVMTDNAFNPSAVDVTSGEEVTFRFRNDGAILHEAYFGDAEEQAAHHEAMSGHGGGGHGADDDEAVAVEPGATADVTFTPTSTGAVLIGCHEPGHWEAGMSATITVT